MLKKSIYPKTKRVSRTNPVVITEKLDGSNLCIFKLDDSLLFATRNHILSYTELENSDASYPGLSKWAGHNYEYLNTLHNNSVLCGEWISTGKIKYDKSLHHTFYMYAKANIDTAFELYNIFYDHDLFGYCFHNQIIPECIRIVPVVATLDIYPTIMALDSIYDDYKSKENRKIEGFVVSHLGMVKKYIRSKNGKETPHQTEEDIIALKKQFDY